MRLVIAHTPLLRPEVKQLGESLDAEFVDVSDSDQSYFRLFDRLWSEGAAFINNEHDVLAQRSTLQEMADCDSEWCAGFAWRYPEFRAKPPVRYRSTALLCNKFSAALIARAPGAMKDAAQRCPTMRWTMLDLTLVNPSGVLQGHPYFAKPCLHGPVTHLRQQHPDWVEGMTESEWVDA